MPAVYDADGNLVEGALASLSLEQLKEWIWGIEAGYGPLIAIGHTAEGTAGTFSDAIGDIAEPEVRPINEGQQITVPGKTEVCRGQVFILGQLQWVAVFR